MSKNNRAPFKSLIVKFGCQNCGRRWRSASGNIHDYQLCKQCYEKVYPSGYHFEAPNKRGNQNRETYEAHNTDLCGKCIRLGHSCMELTLADKLQTDATEPEFSTIIVCNEEEQDVQLTNSISLTDFVKPPKTKSKNKKKKKAGTDSVATDKVPLSTSRSAVDIHASTICSRSERTTEDFQAD